MTDGKSLSVIIYKFNVSVWGGWWHSTSCLYRGRMTDGKSLSVIIYISLTLVYEEVDDTLPVISIETEWQMVSHYQLLYK
jgi:hypothetical protein